MFEEIQAGDEVLLRWNDGETMRCMFEKIENGFVVCFGKDGKRIVCRPQNAKIVKI